MTTVFYQNPYLPHSLRETGAAAPPAKKRHGITKDNRGLPIGTAAQVMQWVGDDPDRAQAFLVKEQKETRPRVSLVANLKAVLKRHEIAVADPEPPAQLAPQIDVIPAERSDIIEGVIVANDAVDQLSLVRKRLQIEE